jgi:hypothetical protein
MREGFALRFPFTTGENIRECLAWSNRWVSDHYSKGKGVIWFVPM